MILLIFVGLVLLLLWGMVELAKCDDRERLYDMLEHQNLEVENDYAEGTYPRKVYDIKNKIIIEEKD